eukprot:Nitzschia sp. Nitz4//scaffold3_size479765//443303//444471//NITZ4_000187-RA/size479765-processed-gene-1.275-mRNA-1//1//CDS//3329551019//6441//frame0
MNPQPNDLMLIMQLLQNQNNAGNNGNPSPGEAQLPLNQAPVGNESQVAHQLLLKLIGPTGQTANTADSQTSLGAAQTPPAARVPSAPPPSVGGISVESIQPPANQNSSNAPPVEVKEPVSFVPCRARSTYPGHDSNTAYFTIPRSIKHGANLYCSHAQCRKDGVKFCYCIVCGIPVAKRNFRQRHEHAIEVSAMGLESSHNAQALPPPLLMNASSVSPAGRGPLNDSVPTTKSVPATETIQSPPVNAMNMSKPPKDAVPIESKPAAKRPMIIIDPRWERWATLLHERPSDSESDELSKWLLKVMDVSCPEGEAKHRRKKRKSSPERGDTLEVISTEGSRSPGPSTLESGIQEEGNSSSDDDSE